MLFRAESPHLNQLNSTTPQERNIKKIYISDKNIYSIIINRHSSSRNYKYELCLYDMSMNFAKIDYLNFTIITNNCVVYRCAPIATVKYTQWIALHRFTSTRLELSHFSHFHNLFWSVVKKENTKTTNALISLCVTKLHK